MASQWLTSDPCIPDDMVYIRDGEFEMGDHHDGLYNALPVYAVLLNSFFMSRYETTNRQYRDYLNSAILAHDIKVVVGIVYDFNDTDYHYPFCDTASSSPYSQIDYDDLSETFSVRTKGGRDMSNDPMVMVSWYGAAEYCNWRSGQEGYQELYDPCDPNWPWDFAQKGYRLPTEAEWEYAARGGEHSPYYRFPWGDTISHSQANYYSNWSGGAPSYSYDISPTEGWHPNWHDGITPYTSVVGSFASNDYGLYDMAGNVWDWCNDWYDPNYYDERPYDNPQGPASGDCRVSRGGSWLHNAPHCRVACRDFLEPDTRSRNIGFRIILDLN